MSSRADIIYLSHKPVQSKIHIEIRSFELHFVPHLPVKDKSEIFSKRLHWSVSEQGDTPIHQPT